MVAALLRSLNSGIQDDRLLPHSSNPQIKMFLKAFIRAGRFTTQFTRLDFDLRPRLGGKFSLTIPRKGHLLSRLYLVTTMPDIAAAQLAARAACDVSGVIFAGPTFGWTNSLGHALLSEATVDIGGSRCDRLDGPLLEVLDEFYTPLEKTTLMNTILPRKDNGFTPGSFGLGSTPTVAVTPLPFWFSSGDSGLFLPIDAIQADSVVLNITFNSLNSLFVSTGQVKPNMSDQHLSGTNQKTSHECVDLPGNSSAFTTTTVETTTDTIKNYIPAAGDRYFPLAGSPFYYKNDNGDPVKGLTGNPDEISYVYPIPGIKMPTTFSIGDTYIMAEYVYLDKPEANQFRIADIQVAIPQHFSFDKLDTEALPRIQFPLKVPNPTRNLFFYLQRWENVGYNAPFLATRDLSGTDARIAPWWPDATGLNVYGVGDYAAGFSTRESEPISSVELIYEGKLTRYWTDSPSIFRSLIPSFEMRKSPWVNRYFYTLPFGLQHGFIPPSLASGEANLDKIVSIDLLLGVKPNRGSINPNDVPRYNVNVWAQTYNILRVYGGRAGLLFAY